MIILDAIFGAVLAIVWARTAANLAMLLDEERALRRLRWDLEHARRHRDLWDRHDKMMWEWTRRMDRGVVPTPQMEAAEEFLFDLLDCEDAGPGQLDRAEAVMAGLDREQWMFLN